MAKSGDGGTVDQLPFATADGKTKATSGGSSGAHDFITDPKDGAPKTGGGFDVTQQNRPQQSGSDPVNTEDAIEGGKLAFPTFPDPAGKGCGSVDGGSGHKPFKVKGG